MPPHYSRNLILANFPGSLIFFTNILYNMIVYVSKIFQVLTQLAELNADSLLPDYTISVAVATLIQLSTQPTYKHYKEYAPVVDLGLTSPIWT